MDNFFSSQQNNSKTSLGAQLDNLKSNYETIFIEAAESIRKELNQFKPEDPCKNCHIKDCKVEKKDIFTVYPVNCEYRDWQLKTLTYLAGDYRQKLKVIYKNIMNKKNEYTCSKCGECCRLATSEYSYNQLKQYYHLFL